MNNHRFLRFAAVLILLISTFTAAIAYDFEVDGIYYKISGTEAYVTSGNGYSGEIVIPESVNYNGTSYSVTRIDNRAFHGCNGVTSVVLPNTITDIGDYAFTRASLSSLTIPNSVTRIGSFAFLGNPITSLSLGNSVTRIEHHAFQSCEQLPSVVFPSSLEFIGDDAFAICPLLTSITIPKSVTVIGLGVFTGNQYCGSHITNMIVEEGNPVYDSREGCNAIIETATNKLISGCNNSVIPSSVKAIENRAFEGCWFLNSIIIPNSVTSIGQSAFAICKGLTSIEVDSNNVVYDSRGNCNAIIETTSNTLLYGCDNSTIPNTVSIIGEDAFRFYAVDSIFLPSSVITIGKSAFEYSGLSYIEIPNTVTSIGMRAFYSCGNLISINLPNSITCIERETFYHCNRLRSVTIPNSVKTIASIAFQYCWELKELTIGSGVESIGENAFNNNYLIEEVNCLGTVPPAMLQSNVFNNATYENGILHVPGQSKEAYRNANYWNMFASIEGYRNDVNGDGIVSIKDVSALIDMLLGGNTNISDYPEADINGDGIVSIGDVTALVDILLMAS